MTRLCASSSSKYRDEEAPARGFCVAMIGFHIVGSLRFRCQGGKIENGEGS